MTIKPVESDSPRRPKSLAWGRLVLWVFLLSLTVRVLWVAHATAAPISDHHGYNRSAVEWIKTGNYRVQGYLYAYKPPGYPALLATTYYLFGRDWRMVGFEQAMFWNQHDLVLAYDWKLVGFVQAVLGALSSGLLALLAAKTVSYRTGIVAGLLHTFWPTSLAFVPVLANDNLLVPLMLIGILCLLGIRDGRGAGRISLACLAGLCLGIMILVRPSSIFFVPAWFVLAALDPARLRWRLRALFPCVACAALVIGPWLYYTYSVGLGVGVFSTQGGYALWWGNNWRSVDGGNPPPPRFPGDRQLGEREQHEFFMAKARDWIRSNPRRYLALCRTRLVRMFGKQQDAWAAKYFFPTAENDALIRATFWKHTADPEDIKEGRALELRNRALHLKFRLVAAPLMALAVLLALLRPRTYAYVLAPLLFYALGHVLTAFAGRYRVTSDPLILVCLGGFIANIAWPAAGAGFWRGRWPKIALAAAVVAGSIYVHLAKVDRGWYRLPAPPEPQPEFNAELGQCRDLELSPDAILQRPKSKACGMELEWTDAGLRCDLTGAPADTGYQYGGIALAAEGMTALRLDMTWEDPFNIDAIFVEGRDEQSNTCAKWQWRPRAASGSLVSPGRQTYVLVAGQHCGHFTPHTHISDCQVSTLRLLVRIVRNTHVGFVLHGVSIAARPGEPNPPADTH